MLKRSPRNSFRSGPRKHEKEREGNGPQQKKGRPIRTLLSRCLVNQKMTVGLWETPTTAIPSSPPPQSGSVSILPPTPPAASPEKAQARGERIPPFFPHHSYPGPPPLTPESYPVVQAHLAVDLSLVAYSRPSLRAILEPEEAKARIPFWR